MSNKNSGKKNHVYLHSFPQEHQPQSIHNRINRKKHLRVLKIEVTSDCLENFITRDDIKVSNIPEGPWCKHTCTRKD